MNKNTSDNNMIERERNKYKTNWFNHPYYMNVKTNNGNVIYCTC